MDQKERALRTELKDLEAKLQDPTIFGDKNYPRLARRKSELDRVVSLYDKRQKLLDDRSSAVGLTHSPDGELQDMAQSEIVLLDSKLEDNEMKLNEALTPKDPNDERDVIIEIRAAAGGDESSLSQETYTACTHAGQKRTAIN